MPKYTLVLHTIAARASDSSITASEQLFNDITYYCCVVVVQQFARRLFLHFLWFLFYKHYKKEFKFK